MPTPRPTSEGIEKMLVLNEENEQMQEGDSEGDEWDGQSGYGASEGCQSEC